MCCYLEAIDLGVFRVTKDKMEHLNYPEKTTTSDEKEIHLNVRARNCIFSIDLFNQVYTLPKANEIR